MRVCKQFQRSVATCVSKTKRCAEHFGCLSPTNEISFPPCVKSLQPPIEFLQSRHRRPMCLSAAQWFSPNRFDFERTSSFKIEQRRWFVGSHCFGALYLLKDNIHRQIVTAALCSHDDFVHQ